MWEGSPHIKLGMVTPYVKVERANPHVKMGRVSPMSGKGHRRGEYSVGNRSIKES